MMNGLTLLSSSDDAEGLNFQNYNAYYDWDTSNLGKYICMN
jgi:hypothetical protein